MIEGEGGWMVQESLISDFRVDSDVCLSLLATIVWLCFISTGSEQRTFTTQTIKQVP